MGFGFLSSFRKPSADDPPPTESWPLFAFGKLPVYKDFISAGLTDDASREFRDWLSNGFSRLWSARDDCRPAEIPLHAFLLGLPESHKVAAGALWGSTDQGGLRRFPFAIFSLLPAGKSAASVLTALDYLPAFESRALEIRRKYEAGGSVTDVYQELRGARIEVPVRTQKQIRLRLAEALARPCVGPFAAALLGPDAPARWPAFLAGLDAAARRPAAGAAAFRIPLGDLTPPLDQMKLWAVRLMQASPSGAVPAGVLYRTGGAKPGGVLFFRDVRAEDILLLHPEAIPTDFVEEIPPPAPEPVPPASTQPAVDPPVGEVRLGAAAEPARGAAPEAPTAPERPVPENPAPPEPAAVTAPAVPASPAVDVPSSAPSSVPTPPAKPEGWDAPLAKLLDAG